MSVIRNLPWPVNAIFLLLLGAFALYGVVLGWLWWNQEKLLFFPEPLPASYPLVRQSDVTELSLLVDGAQLSALHLQLPDPKGVVFFLHGNAGNLADWFGDTALYRKANFDLLMLDYRGYGKSTGRITSEAQLRADVRAVWQQIAPRYAGKKVVLLGQSLGSGLAAGLALEMAGGLPVAGTPGRTPDLTVLVSPYRSVAALAGELYPWVPQILLRYPLRTDAALERLHAPVLLVHGQNDTVIAPQHSEALFQLTRQGKLLRIVGAGHNDVYQYQPYLDGLAEALDAL
jgi:uncharacterized protein